MKKIRIACLCIAVFMAASGGSYALEMGPIDVHGFISQGYLQSSANDYLVKSEKGSFEFNEVGINFSSNLSDKLRLGMQLFARDLGDTGNNEVQVDWAFADYRLSNELGLRLGKIKAPMGLYNESRDADIVRTWVLLPQSVYMEAWRSFVVAAEGGGIYGTLNAGPLGSFEYQDVLGTLGNFNTEEPLLGKQFERLLQPYAFTGQVITADDVEVTGRKMNTLQLVWNTPLEGLRFSSTWTFGKTKADVPAMTQNTYALYDSNADGIPDAPIYVPAYVDAGGGIYVPSGSYLPTLVQVDFPERSIEVNMKKALTVSGEYKWRGLTLAAEYVEEKIGVDYGMNTPALMTALNIEMPSSITLLGYYGSIAYRLTDWLELGTYYSVYYPNKHDKKGEDMVADAAKAEILTGSVEAVDHQAWQKDYCLTARFDINPFWCVKLEGHHMNGTAQVYDYDDVDDLRKVWSLYAVKTSFAF